jgi:hypothetical protein
MCGQRPRTPFAARYAACAGDHAQRWLCIEIRVWPLFARPWRGSPTTRGPADNRATTRRSGRQPNRWPGRRRRTGTIILWRSGRCCGFVHGEVQRGEAGWFSCAIEDQLSRGSAARLAACSRSSCPLVPDGAGTTGSGAVRGRTRRQTSPAAPCGGDQQGRGRSWPWLSYPARAEGLGVDDLVWDDSGAFWSPSWRGRAWPGRLPGNRTLVSSARAGVAAGCLWGGCRLMRVWPGVDLRSGSASSRGCCVLVAHVADSTVGSGGGVHHA